MTFGTPCRRERVKEETDRQQILEIMERGNDGQILKNENKKKS